MLCFSVQCLGMNLALVRRKGELKDDSSVQITIRGEGITISQAIRVTSTTATLINIIIHYPITLNYWYINFILIRE